MMKKNITSLIMILLALFLLMACGGNSNSNNTTASGTPSDNGGNSTVQEDAGDGEETGTPAIAEVKTISENPDPSVSLIELGKGEVFEDDSIRAEFLNFEIIDIPALREGNFADTDPSYSRYMQFRFEITNKISGEAKISVSDISVNETIFTERSYSFSDINPTVVYGDYKIQFSKSDNVELDPTEIETVRFHFFIYDAGKGKNNYMESPIYEGYLVFNTPQ